MKTSESRIDELLSMFYMGHTARTLQEQAQEAARNNWSHIEFLESILSQEASLRHQRVVRDRLTRAHLPVLKTIDTFDWAHPSAIPKQMVLNALSLEFVERKMNLILVGPSGVGKTHIALTLAYAACQKEVNYHRLKAMALFSAASRLKISNFEVSIFRFLPLLLYVFHYYFIGHIPRTRHKIPSCPYVPAPERSIQTLVFHHHFPRCLPFDPLHQVTH